MWPVSTQCEAIRDTFTLQFFIANRCSLILVASFLEVCPVSAPALWREFAFGHSLVIHPQLCCDNCERGKNCVAIYHFKETSAQDIAGRPQRQLRPWESRVGPRHQRSTRDAWRHYAARFSRFTVKTTRWFGRDANAFFRLLQLPQLRSCSRRLVIWNVLDLPNVCFPTSFVCFQLGNVRFLVDWKTAPE